MTYAELYERFRTLIKEILIKSGVPKDQEGTITSLATIIFNQQLILTAIGFDYKLYEGKQIVSQTKPLVNQFLESLDEQQKSDFDFNFAANLEISLKHFLEDLAPKLDQSKKDAVFDLLKQYT